MKDCTAPDHRVTEVARVIDDRAFFAQALHRGLDLFAGDPRLGNSPSRDCHARFDVVVPAQMLDDSRRRAKGLPRRGGTSAEQAGISHELDVAVVVAEARARRADVEMMNDVSVV